MMRSTAVRLLVRQQPLRAQVVQENNPKNRKPVDPPPIIELKYDDAHDPQNAQWMVSPRTFMMVTLIQVKDGQEELQPGKYLIGQTVSSLHRLKDINNKDGGFFVFGDISARKLGNFKLRFTLYDTGSEGEDVKFMAEVDSDVFPVLPQRDFGSMSESTHLTRTFSDQGVKLRVRKDNRAISGIGNKRSYNTSPPESTSPTTHPSIYGGAVQDHHYSAAGHSPAAKRQRSGGEYEHSHLYQHMPVGEPPMPHYSGAIPSGTRYDQQRMQSYSQQSQSPMGMHMMNRAQQPLGAQTSNGWQNMSQPQGALPSPSSSASNQQPSYPAVAGQSQTSSSFGDPGSAANGVPRQYYGNSYAYQNHGSYQNQTSGEPQSAYPDLQMPGSSIPDSGALSSAQSQAYNASFMQSNGIYASESGDAPAQGPYYMGDSKTF